MILWLGLEPMPEHVRGESVSCADWAVLNAPTPRMASVERSSLMLPENSSAVLISNAILVRMSSLRLHTGIG